MVMSSAKARCSVLLVVLLVVPFNSESDRRFWSRCMGPNLHETCALQPRLMKCHIFLR